MADFDEAVLFEQGTVKITREHFIVANQGSWLLTNFVSAETSRYRPRAWEWMLSVLVIGVFMALFDGVLVLLGVPGTNAEDSPSVPMLIYWPARLGWVLVFAGLGTAAMGAILAALINAIWSRYTVCVDTTAGEWKVIFESRDRKQVDAIVNAINMAVGSRSTIPPIQPV